MRGGGIVTTPQSLTTFVPAPLTQGSLSRFLLADRIFCHRGMLNIKQINIPVSIIILKIYKVYRGFQNGNPYF